LEFQTGVIWGRVAEWFKAHAWNACIRESVSRVRIPPLPPVFVATADPPRDYPEAAFSSRQQWAVTVRLGSSTSAPGGLISL
jgi:hypothetical protein